MRVLITGMAGFIGSRLGEVLASEGVEVLGIDNLNSYYHSSLKLSRLDRGGFMLSRTNGIGEFRQPAEGLRIRSGKYPSLEFVRMDVEDKNLTNLVGEFAPDVIVHLAAQPGVRYSIENPEQCLRNNVLSFMRMLEICRECGVRRMLYASSSSVYGNQSPHAFRETDKADAPQSVYAVSKRTNEMLAEVYSEMYGLKLTGLRFFSVYGEWGRPDMAPYIFTRAVLEGQPVKLFNGGRLSRDFTYIEDVVECVRRIVENDANVFSVKASHDVVNIGHGYPTLVSELLNIIERIIGRKADRILLPMQHGEVPTTLADSSKMRIQYGYSPATSLEEGLERFIAWYRRLYPENREVVGSAV